jgi:hypothetical protein
MKINSIFLQIFECCKSKNGEKVEAIKKEVFNDFEIETSANLSSEKSNDVQKLFKNFIEKEISFRFLLQQCGYTLVGSRATGQYTENSDYDYAITDLKVHNELLWLISNYRANLDDEFEFSSKSSINYRGNNVTNYKFKKNKNIDFFYTPKILSITEQIEMHNQKTNHLSFNYIKELIDDYIIEHDITIEVLYNEDKFYQMNVVASKQPATRNGEFLKYVVDFKYKRNKGFDIDDYKVYGLLYCKLMKTDEFFFLKKENSELKNIIKSQK